MRHLPAILLCLLLASCGGEDASENGLTADQQPASPSIDTARSEPDTSAAAAPDTMRTTDAWTVGVAASEASARSTLGSGTATLQAVRTGQHGTFDRVVFEFSEGTLPGYEVEYVDEPVRKCGSGEEMQLEGDGQLRVRLRPANAHTEAGEATVTERDRSPAMPLLKALNLTCDFEGTVTWVLGLAAPNEYRVLQLQDPARLVVDVRRESLSVK